MPDPDSTHTSSARPALVATGVGVEYRRYLKKVTTLKSAVVSLFRGSHYEKFWALRDWTLTLKPGARIGIVGPNGSGKSTLLKVVAGVLPPTEGSIDIQGRVAPLLELGAGFRPDLTGRENVFLNGAIMGVPEKLMQEKLPGILEFAGIGDFIDAPLHTYSSGMRTRLGFSVATDVDPDILLLDEVFSAGDAAFRAKATKRVHSFFESNITILMASHNMSQVKSLCERVLYVNKGRIIAQGDPAEVVERYQADQKDAS